MPDMQPSLWGLQGLSTCQAPPDTPSSLSGGQDRVCWPISPRDEGPGVRMASDLPTEQKAEAAQVPGVLLLAGALATAWAASLPCQVSRRAPGTKGTGAPGPSGVRTHPGRQVPWARRVLAPGAQGGRGWGAQWHPLNTALGCLWSECMNVSRIQSRTLAWGTSGRFSGAKGGPCGCFQSVERSLVHPPFCVGHVRFQ